MRKIISSASPHPAQGPSRVYLSNEKGARKNQGTTERIKGLKGQKLKGP